MTIEITGNEKKKKASILAAWWKIDYKEKGNDEIKSVDDVDYNPMPRETEKGKFRYFKNDKEYILSEYSELSLYLMSVCSDPNCTDEGCIEYRAKQKHSNY